MASVLIGLACGLLALRASADATPISPLIFSCAADNDIFVVLQANDVPCKRYESAAEAVRQAPRGAGVLLLADAFPEKTILHSMVSTP